MKEILDSEKYRERFLSRIKKTPDCWLWTGTIERPVAKKRSKWIYGRFNVGKKKFRAHRVSYAIHCGEILDGMKIDHICRNTLCVRPDHLRIATNRLNITAGKTSSLNENKISKYVGVTWDKERNKWKAQIRGYKGRKHNYQLGRFHTEEEAAEAYQRALSEIENATG